MVKEKNSTNLLIHSQIEYTFKSNLKFKRKGTGYNFRFIASYHITSSVDFNTVALERLGMFMCKFSLKNTFAAHHTDIKGPISSTQHCGRLLLFSNDEMISDWLFDYRGFPLFLVDSKRATARSYLSLCWPITSIPIVRRIRGSWTAFQKMPQTHL